MSSVSIGSPDRQRVPFSINQTDLLAGTTQQLIAPVTGYLDKIRIVVQAAVTTGGTVTPKSVPAVYASESGLDTTSFVNSINEYESEVAGTGSKVACAGAQVTVANSATVGTVLTAIATVGDPSNMVIAGQAIELDLAGFATAGALNGYLEFRQEELLNGPSG